ncbi:MAG: SGNH/GDSL hydrolase family protein, partial [Candidatus Omnitrophica bacterium]|nr:SGNH/GDSL hydrolase family protein [Candidatus Omnitrophota bacterium]
YSNCCQQIGEAQRIPFINIRQPLEEAQGNIFCDDGFHPNDLGHSIIAETIFNHFIENQYV